MTNIILLAIGLCIFAAAFVFIRIFFAQEEEERARKALGLDEKPRVVKSALLKLSRPMYMRLLPFTSTIKADEWRRKRHRMLVAAGMTDEINVEEFLAYKFFLTMVAAILILCFTKGRISWYWWLAFLFLGFHFPDMWLKGRLKERQTQIIRALPNVVDMLALSVEAGMDFMGAIGRVVAKSKPGAMVEELGIMLNEMRMGATRHDALRALAYRCDVSSLSSFVSILVQADRLGVSIGKVLRAQSDKMRTERFQRAEQLGAQASQKIIFPLVMCIMPAVFIIIFGPMILRYGLGY